MAELVLKTWSNEPALEYKEVLGAESHGRRGSFGVRIFATVDRKLSEAEKTALCKAEALIVKAIRTEDMRLDPEAQERKTAERSELLALFSSWTQVQEIPNGYCSDWCCTQKPWYRVLTSIGWFTIGWRKRVLNIDWTETVNKKSGEELFPTYQPTKSGPSDKERYLHAYGYEPAKELIAKIIAGVNDAG